MSIFHDSIRDILEDVQRFLVKTLCKEVLSVSAISHKEGLLLKIDRLRIAHPQLHLEKLAEDGDDLQSSSPQPYTDMHGNVEKVTNDENNDRPAEISSLETNSDYETFGSESGERQDRRKIANNESGENSSNETYGLVSGFLAKKGKDGLSGLLRPSSRHWVTISGTTMSFYNKMADKHPISQLDLTSYESRILESSKSPSSKVEATFELVSPGKKTYQYVAADVREMNMWLQAIQRARSVLAPPEIKEKADDQQLQLQSLSLSLSPPQPPPSLEKPALDEDTEAMYEVVGESGAVWAVPAVVTEYETFDSFTSDADESDFMLADSKISCQEGNFNPTDWYMGLWDCVSDDPAELDFYRGDVIYVISRDYDKYLWWVAAKEGKVGLVPKNYLTEAFEFVR